MRAIAVSIWPLLGLLILVPVAAPAWAGCSEPLAQLVSAQGSVSIRAESAPTWQPAASGQDLCAGDFVRVGRSSRAAVRVLSEPGSVRIDQNTTLQIRPDQTGQDGLALILKRGVANFFSRISRHLSVGTPFVNGTVEGTEFMVSVGADFARFDLYEGKLRLTNASGELELNGRQSARANRDEPPRHYQLLRPRDAVQWTFYFDPLLAALLASGPAVVSADLRDLFERADATLRGGDSAGAFALLDGVAAARRGAAFHTLRAALYLTVGRVDAAQSDIAAAKRIEPGNADARAIEAFIRLTLNDKDRALALAKEAAAASPHRPLPWFVLSYARQAHFDLPAAMQAAQQAVDADADNGLLRARLAELLLARGNLGAGFAEADQALQDAPESAFVWRIRGFAALLRIAMRDARDSFDRALALDPADPYAHLGKGLTLIRSGELADGREELELAVAFSPRDAFLRTNLGRAYYEEKRDERAATAYELAQEADPKDPTPWLYEAILLRHTNRPVEALQALETSIALNPNRALFRPQATLEGDAAARVATLGQVYRDLGFEQLALLEGWHASQLASDDHAGHRLLAEVYSVLPRHEEARVSELLQAQLLQPISRMPVQPLSAEARLLVPEGLAPSRPGLNEYDSLFEREGISVFLTGQIGNQEILGDEVLASGLIGNTAFSVGQYHLDTLGSGAIQRTNQDIVLGFVQSQITPRTSVQAELRRSQIRFGPSVDDPRELTYKDETARVGFAHRWGPGSTLIGSFIYRTVSENDLGVLRADGEAWSAEVRQDWHLRQWRFTAGSGYYQRDADSSFQIFPLDDARQERFAQAYLYTHWRPLPPLNFDVGLSYEALDRQFERSTRGFASRADDEIYRLNPKVGATWRPTDHTTLRAAAFRTLRRPVLVKQTIEPTEVAGFNQLFDGVNGETAWRYGVGLDHRFSDRLFTGVEFSLRDLRSPILSADGAATSDTQRERFVRGYVYWTPSPRTAISGEYYYEQQVIGVDEIDDRTHRVPIRFSYYHPTGVTGILRANYVHQAGRFEIELPREAESFWTWDLGLSYRLPKRIGLVSIAVNNLFDAAFDYIETDPNRPLFAAERNVVLRGSFRF